MRATMRITWLLLSLSFLCHIICSNGQSVSNTTNTSDPVSAAAVTTVTLTAVSTAAGKLAAASSGATAATVTNPPTVTTINSASMATPAITIAPSTPPITTQPPQSTSKDTNKQSETTSIISSTTAIPVVGAGSGTKGAGTSPVGGTTHRPTPAGKTTPDVRINTSQPTAVSTITPAPGTRDMSQTTSTSVSSQVDSKQGTQQAAATPTSGGQVTATDTTWTTRDTIASFATKKAGDPTAQTPKIPTRNPTISPITTPSPSSASPSKTHTFEYPPPSGQVSDKDKDLATLCKQLTAEMKDTKCTLVWRKDNNKVKFDLVEITGKVKAEHAAMRYEEITRKPTDNKTLIAILASCGALLIMIVIFAVCASHHRKPYNENQQHLTEELHTVENGYHDNPTLEVMEVQPEMQEKKMALNGEFNDSWIVPIDNLLKEDIPDEEDTHL